MVRAVLLAAALAGCGGQLGPRDGGPPGGKVNIDGGIGGADAGICPPPCFTVITGGDAGSALPDPGVIFAKTDLRHLVADPQRNIVYGSVFLGAVQAISTETGALLWQASLPSGFQPTRLAITDDGSQLYVAHHSTGLIGRIDTSTQRLEIIVSVPNADATRIVDLATIPGTTRSLLVATLSGALILDETFPRPDQVSWPANLVEPRLELDGPTTAYLLDAAGGSLTGLALSDSGVQAATAAVTGLFDPDTDDFRFDGELAFGDDGHVVDPRGGVLLGTIEPGTSAVDRAANRAYVDPRPVVDPSRIVLDEYDRTGFIRLRRLMLGFTGASNGGMLRAADGTLVLLGGIVSPEPASGVLLLRPEAWRAAVAP